MIVIHHRKNQSVELAEVPVCAGIEIDLRSEAGELIVQHDPFKSGELLSEWLPHYRQALLVLNIKEEGLEFACLELMKNFKIDNFFFLDQSFPFLIKTTLLGERRSAVRVSEYESVQTALAMSELVEWVWIDCFTRFPLSPSDCRLLKEKGLKLCLVSPELVGRTDETDVHELQNFLRTERIKMDAVCTKLPQLWQSR